MENNTFCAFICHTGRHIYACAFCVFLLTFFSLLPIKCLALNLLFFKGNMQYHDLLFSWYLTEMSVTYFGQNTTEIVEKQSFQPWIFLSYSWFKQLKSASCYWSLLICWLCLFCDFLLSTSEVQNMHHDVKTD